MISSLGEMVFGIKPKIKCAARFLGEDRQMIVQYQAGNWTYSGDERHTEIARVIAISARRSLLI